MAQTCYVKRVVIVSAVLTSWLAVAAEAPDATRADQRVLVMGWNMSESNDTVDVDLWNEFLVEALATAWPDRTVVGMAEVELAFRLEWAKELIACDELSCAAEIALALDASTLVRGSIGSIDDSTFAVLKLVDADSAETLARSEGTFSFDTHPRDAIRRLVDDLVGVALPVRSTAHLSDDTWRATAQRMAVERTVCRPSRDCQTRVRNAIDDIESLLVRLDATGELQTLRAPLQRRVEWLYRRAAELRLELVGQSPRITDRPRVVVRRAPSSASAEKSAPPQRTTKATPTPTTHLVVVPVGRRGVPPTNRTTTTSRKLGPGAPASAERYLEVSPYAKRVLNKKTRSRSKPRASRQIAKARRGR